MGAVCCGPKPDKYESLATRSISSGVTSASSKVDIDEDCDIIRLESRMHVKDGEDQGVVYLKSVATTHNPFSSSRFAGPRDDIGMVSCALVQRVMDLVDVVGLENCDPTDHEWEGPPGSNGDVVEWLLWSGGVLPRGCFQSTLEFLTALCRATAGILMSQPVLLELRAPVKVFGDIHGQLRDLLVFFNEFGRPSVGRGGDIEIVSYIFNGDFVDRGVHQLEVIMALFALKVTYPNRVWLIRGNHEDYRQNCHMKDLGFMAACKRSLGEDVGKKVFDCFHQAFDCLPLAATVESKVLVVHGGIGDGKWDLPYIQEKARRPLNYRKLWTDSVLFNLLWSDPVPEDQDGEDPSIPNATFGVHSSPRGSEIKKFGSDVTRQFCDRNKIQIIVRSHECTELDYGYALMHGGKVMRVFSARNYDNIYENAAAILLLGYKRPMDTGERSLVIRAKVVRPSTDKESRAKVVRPSTSKVFNTPSKTSHNSKHVKVEVDEDCDVVHKSDQLIPRVWQAIEGARRLHEAAVVGRPSLCCDRFGAPPGVVGEMAEALVSKAMELVGFVGAEPADLTDREWHGPDICGGNLVSWLLAPVMDVYDNFDDGLVALCEAAAEIVLKEPALVELRAPMTIIGDVQGQFRNLLLFFYEYGRPTVGRGGLIEIVSYIFNGGWYGGVHQLEVAVLLLALKVTYPMRVFLLLSIPESAPAAGSVDANFHAACMRYFRRGHGQRVFESFQATFACLPLAATIEGQTLVVPRGIGNGKWSLDDLRNKTRTPMEYMALEQDPLTRGLLWSQPDECLGATSVNDGNGDDHRLTFSGALTTAFCERNSVDLIVCSAGRALQEGHSLIHDGKLMCVSSARNASGEMGSDAAMLVVGYQFPCAPMGQRRSLAVRAKVIRHAETKEGEQTFKRHMSLSAGCLQWLRSLLSCSCLLSVRSTDLRTIPSCQRLSTPSSTAQNS